MPVPIYNFKINQSRFHVALHFVHFVYSMLTRVDTEWLLLLLFNNFVAIYIPFLFQLLGSVRQSFEDPVSSQNNKEPILF